MTVDVPSGRATGDLPSPLIATRKGSALHLQLDRPTSLNALNHAMVKALRASIAAAQEMEGIATIVLSGNGDRAFSAGGDLKPLREDALGDGTYAMPFWADLYGTVADISASEIPVVSLFDGIVFGGGLGLAGNCQVRVATERCVAAMPETRIGFYPDTGGLSLLAGLAGETGTYLGTCAQSVGAADALAVGLVDHFVWHSDLPAFTEAIGVLGLEEALAAFASEPTDEPALPAAWVDECFAGDDAAEILERLRGHEHPDAVEAAELFASRSPAAVAVTLKGLRTVADLTLVEDLELELRITDALRRSDDFVEGVRARVVDKDRDPSWVHTHVSEVDPAWVESIVS
ncbi:enoyl-CoA hydratase/isomerase family protein [Nocardioides yefusunii]|uniref:3-hydroxyisobutyryl-CoA hydrolase n=1 Tax=Nocardioides yefusunii TaxID=2500546 RepID=A0ABW1R1L2_9ACTN|nr:enoyl-CoA hydratase/isomerase family protein [Nocardioides yefusunii]